MERLQKYSIHSPFFAQAASLARHATLAGERFDHAARGDHIKAGLGPSQLCHALNIAAKKTLRAQDSNILLRAINQE